MSQKLDQAKQAIREGNKRAGQRLLTELLKANPQNDDAWVWLAATITDTKARRECLERALAINPANRQALRGLADLRPSETRRPDPARTQTGETATSMPPARKASDSEVTPTKTTPPDTGRSGLRPMWLLIGGTLLLLLGLCGGALLVGALSNGSLAVWSSPTATFTPTATPPTPTATPQPVANQPSPPSATATQLVVEMTATPTQTPRPTATPTPSATLTPLPTPTTPTELPQNDPNQFSNSDAPTSGNQPEPLSISVPTGPAGRAEVSPSLGTGWNWGGNGSTLALCSLSDPGYRGAPRLEVGADHLLRLSNFQPGESVDLYVYDSSEFLSKTMLQTDSFGNLSRQIVDDSADYVYVAIGNRSGEVINAIGPTFCGSIRDTFEARFVVTMGPATLWDEDDNPHNLPPNTWLKIVGSRWADLNTLMWSVETEDDLFGYIDDRQVRLEYSDPPTPVSQSPPSLASVSAGQAVEEYFALLTQEEYETAWYTLSNRFRSERNNNDFTSYPNFWGGVESVQFYTTQVLEQNQNYATIEGNLTIVYRDGRPSTSNPNYQVLLIWDSDNEQWLIDETRQ